MSKDVWNMEHTTHCMHLNFVGIKLCELQIASIFVDSIFVDAGNESTWLTTLYQETFVTN